MLRFKNHKLVKQGGSYIVSLPMVWVKGFECDLREMIIEQNPDNSLRITPATPQQE
jgi:hypothetical protein